MQFLGVKHMRWLALAAVCAGLAYPLGAQGAGDSLKALQSMLGQLASKPAAPASHMGSIAAVKAALRGKWEAQIKTCYNPSDSYIWAEDGGWSGYEFSCTVPAKAYTLQGFSGTLSCAAEGSEYEAPTELVLSADGSSAKVTNMEDGSVQTLVKCPKETDSILP